MRLPFACEFVHMQSSCAHVQCSLYVACTTQGACSGRDGDCSDSTCTPPLAHNSEETFARARMVRAVRAGASASWSHSDALQRRRVRRSRARLRYFEGPRVCRHVILSRVLRTLPWWLKDPAQPRASAREQGTMPGYPGREPSPISQTWRSVKPHFPGRPLPIGVVKCRPNGLG